MLPTLKVLTFDVKSLNHMSDEELIELIAEDDERAFKTLFYRYWEIAYQLASTKLRSRDVAQEIVDDLFLSFWQRRHALQIGNFRHYLHIAIKYKVITYIKHQLSRDQQLHEYQLQLPAYHEGTMREVEYNDLLRAFENGMKVLPEKTQEVFRLSRIEGLTVAEIANELNVSEKAIEYHITRSRKELRLYLKDFLVLLISAGTSLLT